MILTFATGVHQAAAATWIGALSYLLPTSRKCTNSLDAVTICKSFSKLALCSVPLLFCAGLVLSEFYISDPAALYGTTYGIRVTAKALLFALILLLGAMNFRLIRNPNKENSSWLKSLSGISEAEIGIGITVILAAASLTSQPPAIDLTNDRVALVTIAQRISPKLPRMNTPPLSTLSPSTRELWKQQHPAGSSNAEAYIPGHGQYVLLPRATSHGQSTITTGPSYRFGDGCVTVLARSRWFSWAKHWPVAFVGLAVFLLLRADPENWPLGPSGFWESFTSTDVAQHRLFVLLIVLFAAFEWGVQTGRLTYFAKSGACVSGCLRFGKGFASHPYARCDQHTRGTPPRRTDAYPAGSIGGHSWLGQMDRDPPSWSFASNSGSHLARLLCPDRSRSPALPGGLKRVLVPLNDDSLVPRVLYPCVYRLIGDMPKRMLCRRTFP